MIHIAVLLPHYNDPIGLSSTLESIDNGNYYLHLVIVDDGSLNFNTPKKSKIEAEFRAKGVKTKVHLLELESNKGVEHALNFGLEFIFDSLNVSYILRIDCGDLCINNRIQKQIEFLESNLEIDLVGSWVKYSDENSNYLYTLKLPVSHDLLLKRRFIRVPFIHSAVLIRYEAFKKIGLYSYEFKAAEDYEIFMRFINKGKTANIPEVLTEVKWRPYGISVKKRRKQLWNRLLLLFKYRDYSLYFFVGVLRVMILMLLPYSVLSRVKQRVYR
ncbi:glycosyltransferase [Fulvivirga lutea]|uniref:Glycosyltransferase n=1 Tax=Fulvivirga lutea TaxID=2810512 RepID=A0A975A2C7_9BACT|nr:glycosyltransferase [Fulvivirga lutea]QSE98397.1 glycosyltransferase [Fulvivirga lutea]